jgi:hypothetical protein
MGWTFSNKEKNVSVKAFFEKMYNSDAIRVLDCKVVGIKTAYLAIESTPYAGPRMVFALVCLLDYQNGRHFNFGYKDMDETMWPNEAKCPQSIFDLLTPTDNENAINWRNECIKNACKNTELKSLKAGDVIKFERTFSFGKYGKNASTFKLIDKKKNYFYSVDLNIDVKLRKSNLLDNPWTIVKGA